MKRLLQLWPDVPAAYAAVTVSALALDSRDVRPGMLFLATRGESHDARDFISAAIGAGAAAVFAEQGVAWPETTVVGSVPVIAVPQLPALLGHIAARFFDDPSQQLAVLAVTGTNGKTSVANLLAGALTRLGKKSGVLGTLGNGLYGQLEKSTHTTLDACRLQGKLAQFVTQGTQCVAMEASSHGLVQGRLNGTAIRVALFTNLTRDHLDYHGDMDNYAAAKEILFRWPGLQVAVLNADDPAGRRYAEVLPRGVRMLSYSQRTDSHAHIRALKIEPTLSGLSLQVATPAGDCEFTTPLLGRFNVSNVLAVMGGLLALDLPLGDIVEALRQAQPVPGRMQSFAGAHPTVVVDYAHTPDALEKVLASLREHAAGRLICVFGCGGDRDRGKRPQMGEIAARLADHVVLTSDNPRSESPQAIVEEICGGIGSHPVVVELDRHRAIHDAVLSAARNDIVLVAGKGHEDYQEVAGVRHAFSDAEEVRTALTRWRGA
ncbi:MAG: UDP-N-acetylmuramoyl-L-alanyl-D-glutamate--2,6-diaminopimelate ligase [Moraxellaceae bacterium]|jgi:UDP-N-acetylmuramyl-tripeptide synthetase|nr:UDP-N-acetylmuramoyl-L-alanyl-D-glutamate--2,6-diaminopimelate ligase [Moraxellaceae bacterium]